jgi:glucokinase
MKGSMIVLAGDIGGTNARLALFEVEPGMDGARPKLTSIFERTTPSKSAPSLDEIAEAFLRAAEAETKGRIGPRGDGGGKGRGIASACLGIAGPIENNRCHATNLPWVVDGRALATRLGIERVTLVNDFSAAALGVTAVGPGDLVSLGGGQPVAHGPIAVLGAGTGLGQAYLLWSSSTDRYEVVPSEGGHADFAPRTPLEAGLLEFLTHKYGRVSCERVLSGNGLVDIFSFLSQEPACRPLIRAETSALLAAPGSGRDAAAEISQRGLAGSDPICEMSLALFCSVLGAVASNLGLSVLATGGVFVAGGIAPRILAYLQKGGFRESFDRKGRLHTLVERLPAFVVTHPQPGLLGAATLASAL